MVRKAVTRVSFLVRQGVCICVRTHEGIRRAIQQLAYSMAIPEPQESAENQYLGHRMLFTLENQRSYQILCIILSNIVYLKLS